MRNIRSQLATIIPVALLALLSTLNSQLSTLFAQGTAFTYQGRLTVNGSLANGNYDLRFNLYTNSAGGSPVTTGLTNPAVAVANGLFTTSLDFGGVFNGMICWLDIGARTNGSAVAFAPLTTRQQLTPSPYAIFAGTAGLANSLAGNAVTTPSIASGTVVRSLNGLTDTVNLSAGSNVLITTSGSGLQISSSGGATSGWALGGNNSTTPANFLGTLDNHPLELRVNNSRALRLEPNTNGAPNVIAGAPVNQVTPGKNGATIAGGGAANYAGSAYINSVTGDFGTVAGGAKNTSDSSGFVGGGILNHSGSYATVSGGQANDSSGYTATVGGGQQNISSNNFATVAGGALNVSGGGYATVAGGYGNVSSGTAAFIGGGGYDGTSVAGNTASGTASTVGGGVGNSSIGFYSTVGGGAANTSQFYGTVGGGSGNNAGGNFSSVAGGLGNHSGAYAMVGGGWLNDASGTGAFVGGGGYDGVSHIGNVASGNASTVAGGHGNSATNQYSTVGGGQANIGGGNHATVGGGRVNLASGLYATIAGGEGSIANSSHATVGGGYNNQALNAFTTVGGGVENTAEGDRSTAAGGENNDASGDHSTVSGGYQNFASGTNSTVSGGYINNASGYYAAILGGAGNIASGPGCTVAGGLHNTASGQSAMSFTKSPATVGGGENNNASGNYATIPGGFGNSADGFASFAAGRNSHANHDGSFVWGDGTGGAYSGGPNRFDVLATGGVGFYVPGGSVSIAADGTLSCKVLTISGADVAEPFEISTKDLPKGSVVIIDENNPGQLKLSDRAYDKRVAGILSGANGVRAGNCLSQQGFNDGGQNVALSGRVYVLADASSSPIKPGDLLTTSNTPGHAMRVTDHGKAQGAILGKAMSALPNGKGMVLVLVTLQ